MDERHDAEHSVAQARQRLSNVAEELSRRASSEHLRKQVREKVKERTYNMTGRFAESPWAGSLLGGAAGVLAGRALAGRLRQSRPKLESKSYGVPGRPDFSPSEEGLGERTKETLKGAAETVKERASDVVERAKEGASSVRERIPSKESIRHTAEAGAKKIRASTEENVGMWAVGALVSGALMGALIPLTRKEGRLLRPAGQKVQQQFSNLKEQAVEKSKVVQEKVMETLSESKPSGGSEGQEQTGQQGSAPQPEVH